MGEERDPEERDPEEHGPIEEPPNSTVSDWQGQKVSEDMELAEELLDETEGDEEEAERRFKERSVARGPDRSIDQPKPS